MARGYLTLAIVGGFLLAAELAGRTFLAPLLLLSRRSGMRDRILTGWMRGLAGLILGVLRVFGDARVGQFARIPGKDGVLVVGNHQSLLDIPVAIRALEDSYPRIVTRRRYANGIPVVSHILELTDSPLVDPERPSGPQIDALQQVARSCRHPLVVFPEGHRSRDGRLRPFRRGGLGAILSARPWTVHLLVVDGLWSAGKFGELVGALAGLRGIAVAVGPIPWPDPTEDPGPFIEHLERRMAAELDRLRARGDR